MHHQWLEGNLPVASKCAVCAKTCGSVIRYKDLRLDFLGSWNCMHQISYLFQFFPYNAWSKESRSINISQISLPSIWCNYLNRNGICYQNCSDLLWEKIVLVMEKNFWNSWLKAENLQNFLRSLDTPAKISFQW